MLHIYIFTYTYNRLTHSNGLNMHELKSLKFIKTTKFILASKEYLFIILLNVKNLNQYVLPVFDYT